MVTSCANCPARHARVCDEAEEKVSVALMFSANFLPYAQRGVQHQLSRFHRTVILLILSTIAIALLLAWSGWLIWLDFIILLSLLKLYVTAAKMVPQAWYNYQRKSTVGWSIENIVMDMTGGILSLYVLHFLSSSLFEPETAALHLFLSSNAYGLEEES